MILKTLHQFKLPESWKILHAILKTLVRNKKEKKSDDIKNPEQEIIDYYEKILVVFSSGSTISLKK